MAPVLVPTSIYDYTQPTRFYYSSVCYQTGNYVPVKRESKKQRIARIAKEKMFASWQLRHEKKPQVFKVIQTCKPRHVIKIFK